MCRVCYIIVDYSGSPFTFTFCEEEPGFSSPFTLCRALILRAQFLKYALQGQGALGRHVLEGANALCTTCLKGHGAQLSLTVSGFGGHWQSKAQGTMTNNNQENLNKCNI